ncbi:MAG: hypothetical protein HY716_15345 [Planctomycetes bacterium]|nr:hypothetical protein [Planctomycetota bacterium]
MRIDSLGGTLQLILAVSIVYAGCGGEPKRERSPESAPIDRKDGPPKGPPSEEKEPEVGRVIRPPKGEPKDQDPFRERLAGSHYTVTAVDREKGIVQAVNEKGHRVEFALPEPALAKYLKVGQKLGWDDKDKVFLITIRVPYDGGEPAVKAPEKEPKPAEADESKPEAAGGKGKGYTISEDPGAKGRMGMILVQFPEKASSHVEILNPGTKERLEDRYGNCTFEVHPGTYDVSISKRIVRVEVKSKHVTKVHVGVLRVHLKSGTYVEVLDVDQKTRLEDRYGDAVFGLPEGTYYVKVAGRMEEVKVEKDKVTDY